MKLPLWTVSGGVKHFEKISTENRAFREYYDTPRNLFNSTYDSIFGLRWNGGRVCSPKDTMDLASLKDCVNEYNRQGIGFNFSFTNVCLKERDLDDLACNFVLENIISTHHLNGVICASELLRDYIKKNYPNVKIIWSVINGLRTPEEYNLACENENNELVVLHPDFNHDPVFLDALSHPEKIEVMANDACAFGCPYRRLHYTMLSQYAIQQSTNPIIPSLKELDGTRNSLYRAEYGTGCIASLNGYVRDNRNILSFSDIEQFLERGFVHFKLIGGREYDWKTFNEKWFDDYLKKYIARKCFRECGLNNHI